MKNLFLIGLMLFSSVAYSANLTVEEKSQLHVLKMMLESNEERTIALAATSKEIASQYEDLGFFDFSPKRRLENENCSAIKTELAVNFMILSASLEQALPAFEKLFKNNQRDRNAVLSNLDSYSKKMTEASDQCKKVVNSAKSVDAALKHLTIANDILLPVIPNLL